MPLLFISNSLMLSYLRATIYLNKNYIIKNVYAILTMTWSTYSSNDDLGILIKGLVS